MTALFLSHSGADRDGAERVSQRLRALGFVAVFLDSDPAQGIQPGQRWEDAIYRALHSTDAVVFLSSDAAVASRWCFAELALARSLGRPIFPARLSGSARHELTADRQEVDLRDGDGGIQRLAEGLRRAGLDPHDAFGWDPTRSPYPGLAAFTAEDAAVFFGRRSETSKLLELLQPTFGRAPGRWVSIVGPSGSGKSSLLHAGLLPQLARPPDRWLVVGPMIPGPNPTRGLAACLATAVARPDRPVSVDELERRLADADPDTATCALRQQVDALREAAGGQANVLIAIDQLEELVTRTGQREQAAFVRLLDDALDRERGLWVVATLRSEFLSTAPERAGLVEVIDDALVLEPLSRARLPEVIARPAARAGLDFEPGLVERIVEETAGGDALPLLAYTLAELAARAERTDRRVTHDGYEAIGGVVGALRRRADRLVEDLTRRGHGPLIVPTLLKLASLDADAVPVRRRLPRSALDPAELIVVDAFVHARLLTSGRDARSADGQATVEVSHEALLRQWEPLRRAIQGAQDALRVRAELGRATADWLSGGRDESYLPRGNRLVQFTDWAKDHPDDVDPDDREFLTAGTSAQVRERDAERRGYRRVRRLAAGLAVVLIVSVVLGVLADRQRREAGVQASLAAGRQLLAQADQAWSTQPDVALLLDAEALRRMPGGNSGEARFALVSRLNQPLHISTVLSGHTGEVNGVAFGPGGRVLATSGDDGTVRFWSVPDGRSLGALPLTEPSRVRSAVYSPNGAVLAVVSGPTVRLWDSATRQQIGQSLVGHTDDVIKAVFSPDGALLATTSRDTTIRLWDVATGRAHGPPLTGHTDTVFDAAFTPDGLRLISAGWDSQIRFWDVRTGRAGPVLLGHRGHVTAVVVSADGSTVVSRGQDGTVRVWNVPTARLLHVLTGHVGPVSSLALSPDGATVASGDDRTVRLWSTATGAPLGPALTGHTDVVIALRFVSPGTVVSGSLDGTLRIWDVAALSAVGPPLTGHNSWINAITVSPDGTVLASASGDGTARLWQVEPTRALGAPLAGGGPGPFYDVAVGPTGTAAAAGGDGDVYLWNTGNQAPAGRLVGHMGSVNAVAFGPAGVLASAGDDTTIRFWDLPSGRAARPPITTGGAVLGLAFSADGRRLASAGANGSVRLWDVADSRLLGVLSGHQRNVNAVAFGPGSVLASGGDDDTLRLWDAATLQPIGGPIPIEGTVRDVAFSPDGSLIAVGGSAAAIRFVDTATRSPWGQPLVGGKNWVNKLAFSPDGKTIAAAADDRFQLWDVATSRADGAPLIATGERVFGAAFSPDGSVLAAASEGSTSLWTVQDDKLLLFACRLANRNLSDTEWMRYFGPAVPRAPTCP